MHRLLLGGHLLAGLLLPDDRRHPLRHRMAGLALVPFGKSIVTTEELARLRQPHTLVVPALGAAHR